MTYFRLAFYLGILAAFPLADARAAYDVTIPAAEITVLTRDGAPAEGLFFTAALRTFHWGPYRIDHEGPPIPWIGWHAVERELPDFAITDAQGRIVLDPVHLSSTKRTERFNRKRRTNYYGDAGEFRMSFSGRVLAPGCAPATAIELGSRATLDTYPTLTCEFVFNGIETDPETRVRCHLPQLTSAGLSRARSKAALNCAKKVGAP